MFYNRSWAGVTMEGFIAGVNQYLRWYCNERIKLSLGPEPHLQLLSSAHRCIYEIPLRPKLVQSSVRPLL